MIAALWIGTVVRWSLTLILLAVIGLDQGPVLSLVLLLLSIAIEILVHQVKRLRQEIAGLRALREREQ